MLRIIGVELTQAIQYFGSTFPVCGSPVSPQPCADNSIPLVAGKPTAVRVYFEGAAQNVPVTGFGVMLQSDGSPSAVTFAASRGVFNVPAPPAREDAGHSLNILIPPQSSSGRWALSVNIFEQPFFGVGQVAARVVQMEFAERAMLQVRLVRMHYKGRGLDIAPPTIAEFWQMADFAQRIFPSRLPCFCIVRESVEVFDGDFTTGLHDHQNGTTGDLSRILRRLIVSEGLSRDVIYFALYPNVAGAHGGASDVGGFGRVTIAPNAFPAITAHEFGHAEGLSHAPSPVDNGSDASVPHYGSLPWGSIGEVGFDPRETTAIAPTFFDWMGRGSRDFWWITPHNYQKLFVLIGAPRPGPCSILPNAERVFRPPIERHFSCYFVEDRPGGGFINKLCGPKIPFQVPWPRKAGGHPGPIRAALLDSQGATIFEDTFELTPISGPRDGPQRHVFNITVPELDGAKRLIVTHGDKVIEDSELSHKPVTFDAKASMLDGSTPAVRVEWVLSPEDGKAPVFVRASSDDGRSWTAFNVPDGARQLDIDPASLPPGDSCLVEVLAGERLRTSSWRSARMPVRTGRDALIVLWPRDDSKVAYGEAIELVATTTYGAGYEEIIWSSDRDGDLGVGGYQLARLSPGRHVLSVRRGRSEERVRAGVVRVANPPAARR